ncbi:MAG: hypothetical protein ACI9HE_000596 [Planctomycetota bacterium]
MTEAQPPTHIPSQAQAPAPRRSWKRRAAWLLGVATLLPVGLYATRAHTLYPMALAQLKQLARAEGWSLEAQSLVGNGYRDLGVRGLVLRPLDEAGSTLRELRIERADLLLHPLDLVRHGLAGLERIELSGLHVELEPTSAADEASSEPLRLPNIPLGFPEVLMEELSFSLTSGENHFELNQASLSFEPGIPSGSKELHAKGNGLHWTTGTEPRSTSLEFLGNWSAGLLRDGQLRVNGEPWLFVEELNLAETSAGNAELSAELGLPASSARLQLAFQNHLLGASLVVRSLRLDDLARGIPNAPDLDGRASIEFKLKQTPAGMELSGRVLADELLYDEYLLGDLELLAELEDGRLSFPKAQLEQDGRLVFDLTGSIPLAPGSDSLLALGELDLQAKLDWPADLGLGLPDGATGHLELGGTWSELEAQVDLSDLSWCAGLSESVQRCSGNLRATAKLSDPFGKPAGNARIDLSEASLRLPGIPVIEGLAGALVLDGRRFVLEDLHGELGAGPIKLSGSLDLDAAEPWNITLKGSNALLLRSPGARVRTDADLRFSGTLKDPLLAGTLGLRHVRLHENVDLLSRLRGNSRPASLRTPLALVLAEEGALADLRVDLRVDIIEPLKISSNVANGSLRGSLKLEGHGNSLIPRGQLFLDPSTVSLPGGRLKLSGGILQFDPAHPFAPHIDINGEARMAGYDISLHASGDASAPTLDLSSSPALPVEQVLLLLLSGELPAEGAGRSTAQSLTVYVAKDILGRWTGGGLDEDDSWLDRLEIQSGQEVSRSGLSTLEATWRLGSEPEDMDRTWYVVAERDRYEDVNFGLRFVVNLR